MSHVSSSLEQAAARNIVRKYLQVRPGENVIVETWPHTLSMASAMVDEVRQVGGRVLVHYEDEDAFWSAMERKQGKLLGSSSEPEWAALQKADVFVMFWGPGASSRSDDFPDKLWNEATAWNEMWYKTARKNGLRGCRMELGHATADQAKEWGVDLQGWRRQLLEGCLADPREMVASGSRLQRAFAKGRRVRITHPNGTDLAFGLAGHPPRYFPGVPTKESRASPFGMMTNLPPGQFAVALDAKTAEGRLTSNRTSYADWGVTRGGSWEFAGGKLTSHEFAQGGPAFDKLVGKAKPGKDRPGFLYIGLNPKVGEVPNIEDTERGTVCASVGRNVFLGGDNASDMMAWLTLAGSEISVDGTPVVRAGRIL